MKFFYIHIFISIFIYVIFSFQFSIFIYYNFHFSNSSCGNWNSFQNEIAIDENYENNSLKDGNYISELMQTAVKKKVFLLVSCTVNDIKKKFHFQNKQNTQFLKFPFLSDDKNNFFNEIENRKESSSYSFNDGNDFLYVIPSLLFNEKNDNRDDCKRTPNGYRSNSSSGQNHGIEIEFASVCLSPPLSNENEMEIEIDNLKNFSNDQNDFNNDYNKSEKYVRAGRCTVRTIEAQLELLLLPSAMTDR